MIKRYSSIEKGLASSISEVEYEINSLEGRAQSMLEGVEVADWIANTSLYNRQGYQDVYSIEEAIASVIGSLSTIKTFAQKNVKRFDEYETLIDKLFTRTANIKNSISIMERENSLEKSNVSFISIRNRAREDKKITREDIALVSSLSFKDFIEGLLDLPLIEKNKAYQSLIIKYIDDSKNRVFTSMKYEAEIAECYHNLVRFSYFDFKNFNEIWFWEDVFKSKTKNYTIENFFCNLQ